MVGTWAHDPRGEAQRSLSKGVALPRTASSRGAFKHSGPTRFGDVFQEKCFVTVLLGSLGRM